MATRTYQLIFGGITNNVQILPQGRFFMLKKTGGTLEIEARYRNGTPVQFFGVEGGFRYSALGENRWYELELRSSVPQAVEIVISDEAEIDFADVVSVQGVVDVRMQTSGALDSASQNVPAGGQVVLSGSPIQMRISVCNPSTNEESFWLSSTGSAGATGVELQPGTTMELVTSAAVVVRNVSATAQPVMYLSEYP